MEIYVKSLTSYVQTKKYLFLNKLCKEWTTSTEKILFTGISSSKTFFWRIALLKSLILDSLNQSVQNWLFLVRNVVLHTLWLLKFIFTIAKASPFIPINVTFILWEWFCMKCYTIDTLSTTLLRKWNLIKEQMSTKSLES